MGLDDSEADSDLKSESWFEVFWIISTGAHCIFYYGQIAHSSEAVARNTVSSTGCIVQVPLLKTDKEWTTQRR